MSDTVISVFSGGLYHSICKRAAGVCSGSVMVSSFLFSVGLQQVSGLESSSLWSFGRKVHRLFRFAGSSAFPATKNGRRASTIPLPEEKPWMQSIFLPAFSPLVGITRCQSAASAAETGFSGAYSQVRSSFPCHSSHRKKAK